MKKPEIFERHPSYGYLTAYEFDQVKKGSPDVVAFYKKIAEQREKLAKRKRK